MSLLSLKNNSPVYSGGFYFSRLLAVFVLFLSLTGTASSWVEPPTIITEKDMGGRLVYGHYRHELTGDFYFIKVRTSSNKWQVIPTINNRRISDCSTVKELAIGTCQDASVSINASFFDSSNFPIGTVAINGEIVSLDNRERTSLGISNNGKAIMDLIRPRAFITADDYFEPIWIWGYNHSSVANSIIAYNYHYGRSTVKVPANSTAICIANNKVVSVTKSGDLSITLDKTVLVFHGQSRRHLDRFKVGTIVTFGLVMPDEWKEISSMVTGGPRIIDNGRTVDLRRYPEGFSGTVFNPNRRTIAGITWNDEIFFAVFSNPVTYESAASVLLELNVMDAMGLDGGSSTSLWVKGITSVNGGRKVPVALSVVKKAETEEQKSLPWFKNEYWR